MNPWEGEGSGMILLSLLSPPGWRRTFFLEGFKTKELPEVFLAMWWSMVQPPSHAVTSTQPGRCRLPPVLHPQRRKEITCTETTTVATDSNQNHPHFFTGWHFYFSLGYLVILCMVSNSSSKSKCSARGTYFKPTPLTLISIFLSKKQHFSWI